MPVALLALGILTLHPLPTVLGGEAVKRASEPALHVGSHDFTVPTNRP